MTTRITGTNITDGSIVGSDIAANTITTSNLNSSVISQLNTAPTITQIQITNSSYTVLDDTAVASTGGYIKITGTNFTAGSQVVIGSVAATSVGFVSSTVLNVQVPAQAAGTYIVYVTTNTGSVAILVNGLTYSGTPTWVTGSTLPSGQVNSAISIQLSATGDAPLTYALQAGSSLPAGLTLTSGGLLSGTITGITVETTYNFTIEAIDAEAQESPRAFSITIAAGDAYFEYVTSLLSAATPTSTFVTDASTNGFAVTVNGDTRPSNFGPYTPGYYSNFFGTAQFKLSTTGMTALGSDFTLEVWIYPTSFNDYNTIFDNRTSDGDASGLVLGLTSAAKVYFYTNAAFQITTATSISLNTWTHIALVRSGAGSGNVKIYINGVADANTATYTTSFTRTAPSIGDDWSTRSNLQYYGYLSNLRATTSALYTGSFTPSTTPLTAISGTVLLTCQSNRFIDNSASNLAITRNGDVRIDSFDPFLPDSNFAGRGSGFFDGTGDYLNVPGNSAFEFGTGNMTMEAYVYRTVSGTVDTILQYGRASVTNYDGISWALYISSSNYAGFEMSDGGSAAIITLTSSVLFPTNAWTHLALVRSGNNFTLYQNGVSVATGSTSASFYIPSSSLFWVARNHNAGTGDTAGYISDVRIVKGTAVYTSAFTPPTAPLTAIANTQLLTLQNNQPNNNSMFLDSSTNNFNITRNGNTTQGTFSPYGGGWSNHFDGGTNRLTTGTSSQFNLSGANITLECWVYMTATPSVFNRLITIGPNNAQSSFYFGIDTGRLVTMATPFGSGGNVTSGSTALALNTWTHIAFVLNGSTGTLYLNGTQVGQTSNWNITSSNSNYFYVGYDSTATVDGKYTGYVSNVRLLVGTALYSGSSFTVPTSPLTPVANTRILTCADNRLIDDSANNFAIGVTGSVSVQRFNPFNPVVTTPTSYSGFFDGTGDYLSVPTNAAFSFGTGDFTIEGWTYLSSNTGAYRTVFYLPHSSGAISVRFGDSGSYNSLFQVSILTTAASNVYSCNQSQAALLNQWVHFAFTRSSGVCRLFLNGTLQSLGTGTNPASFPSTSFNDSTNITSNAAVGIGDYIGAAIPWIGYISNVRVLNGTALYTTNFTPSTTPLTAIANTSLLTCQSATFTDNSTNNFTITAVGDTVPRQFNPFGWTSATGGSAAYTPALYGGSGYLDGSGDYLDLGIQPNLYLNSSTYTIECWVYFTRSPGTANAGTLQAAMTQGDGAWFGSANEHNWYLLFEPSQVNFGKQPTTYTASYTPALNVWTHVAIVGNSSGTITMYINGVSLGTQTSRSALGSASWATRIGLGFYGDSKVANYFQGYITDVRITKGTARYNSNFQPPVAPLTALQNTILLNNMTGAGIYDSSMIVGYETVGNASISTSVKKYGNSSMYFDGSGDYLVSPDGPLIEPLNANLTWEMWINTTSSTQYATLYSRTPASFASGMWSLMINYASSTAGDVALFVADFSGASPLLLTSPLNVRDGAWHHIAVVRNGSAWTLYVDGTSRATGTWSGTIANIAGGIYIGADQFYGRNYAGYIDDLRITNGIARYTANFTPPTTPFIQF